MSHAFQCKYCTFWFVRKYQEKMLELMCLSSFKYMQKLLWSHLLWSWIYHYLCRKKRERVREWESERDIREGEERETKETRLKESKHVTHYHIWNICNFIYVVESKAKQYVFKRLHLSRQVPFIKGFHSILICLCIIHYVYPTEKYILYSCLAWAWEDTERAGSDRDHRFNTKKYVILW